jgi:hypothetical protein
MISKTLLGPLATEVELPEVMPADTGDVEDRSNRHCIHRIRSYVEGQPETVKRELARRTNWCFGAERKGSNLCLIAQVADIRARLGLPLESCPTVYQEFDLLAGAIGLPATVALVRDACGMLK